MKSYTSNREGLKSKETLSFGSQSLDRTATKTAKSTYGAYDGYRELDPKSYYLKSPLKDSTAKSTLSRKLTNSSSQGGYIFNLLKLKDQEDGVKTQKAFEQFKFFKDDIKTIEQAKEEKKRVTIQREWATTEDRPEFSTIINNFLYPTKGDSKSLSKKSSLTETHFMKSIPLKTVGTVRNGMKKPAFKRHQHESLGMVSFNEARNMFPADLQCDVRRDPVFDSYPHLQEFKKRDIRINQNNKSERSKSKAGKRPINASYRSRDGTVYGLYQRFYWDESGVPFAGVPNFKSQGQHGPGKYSGSNYCTTSNMTGGKFSLFDGVNPKHIGPTPTSYFVLGRSEINLEAGHEFDKARRVLPGEMAQMKPDYSNVLSSKLG